METVIYDSIIIGAGPAGITAAIYAARKRLNILVITDDIGGQAAWSGDIENYTGYQFITGPDLASKFEEHVRRYEIPIRQSEPATSLVADGDRVTVATGKDEYRGRSVIIASGKRSRELGVPGEKEFKNRGLTYCATCDGPLFSGRDVAVVGGGNSGLDAVLQLMKIARHVYCIEVGAELQGDAVMKEKVEGSEAVTVMTNTRVTAVYGGKMVEGISVQGPGGEKKLPVGGVFVEIGLIPNSAFAAAVEKNSAGEIIVNARNETNLPGLFAAGDVTDVPEKQIIVAAGEGAKAALGAFHYLSRKR